VTDLKQRGLLEDTLVIWGGEFGRTNYSQGKLTSTDYGRDHHPRCFTTWMAGGGTKSGTVYGETCEFGYNIVKDPVHVNDFHATLLRLLGIDHEQLTYKYQGRRFRLTDVSGRVVEELMA
jgi:arylsulfatase A-like enzyme